ncbi:MAG: ABC transporter permease [Ancalomicrobiaceae bacterium]|nr:ABC transporter permease [Ancalomicrobiaceae bacterium]
MSDTIHPIAAETAAVKSPSAARRRWPRELVLLIVIIAVTAGIGVADPGFVAKQNLQFMILNSVVLSLVALGQTLVIATRGIDLSVAPVMGLGAVVTGLWAQQFGFPLWGAVLASLAMGAVLGTLNGVLVANLNIPPIIVTLGTYSIYGGIVFIYSDGVQVYAVPPEYATFGNASILPFLPIPIPVVILAGVLGLSWYMLEHTVFGRALLAVGNNAAAAYSAGISCASTVVRTYAIAGTLACFAGLIFVSYTGSATVMTGTGDHIELQSIAVALIGGTAAAGGRGNLIGTVMGSLFLSVILTALVFMHVPPIWYSAGEGLMILIAVTVGMNQSRAGGERT